MISQCRLIIAATSLVFACTSAAETVYKSVDERGRVTYSSSPPRSGGSECRDSARDNCRGLLPPTGLAQWRQVLCCQATQRAEQQRQDRRQNGQEQVSAAEKELRNAELALQKARIKSDDDWQRLASGGRVLKQRYLDRVKTAEQRVQQAKRQLSSARLNIP